MNSDERRAARRKRREEKRAEKRRERIEGCTLERVADLNSLYDAASKAKRGVAWKASVQRYQMRVLRNIAKAHDDLLAGNDIRRGFTEFDIIERGKPRHISSVHFSERVIHKSLSKNALVPAIVPTFTSGNSANISGRGTDYAIRRLKKQLARHWRKHGDEGYILLVDFRDYFANIDHEAAKDIVRRALDDERLIALTESLIDAHGDVGLGLGSEPNQTLAVALPSRIDHWAEEMPRLEATGRYMDDSYYIDTDKRKLRVVLACIEILCEDLGIEINHRKTRIVKLSRGFRFLKKRFSYSPSGKVIVRPCRDSITRERRKLKAMRRMLDRGEITREQIDVSYQSWRGGMRGLDAHGTVLSMDALYRELFGQENQTGGGFSLIENRRALLAA
nr:MAG: MatK/TrnK amino terminal region [Bacteriophage sp.]